MPDDSTSAAQQLKDYGMTDEEVALFFDLAAVAGRVLNLPMLHPNERREVVNDFHNIQNRLLARPGLRAQGWPRS